MTNAFKGRTYWIVGASEGLGAEIARKLDKLDAKLILSARNQDKLAVLAGELSNARPVAMDVTDGKSVSDGIVTAGDVHGVIYCVGQYTPMQTQDWDLETSMRVIDANYLGAVRLFAGVAPRLFAQGRGILSLSVPWRDFTAYRVQLAIAPARAP